MYCCLTSIDFLSSRNKYCTSVKRHTSFFADGIASERVSASLLFKKRLSLSVLVNNSAALEGILANDTREGDQDGEKEQDTHDDKGKDPLEGDDVGEELRDTQRCAENAEVETHGVVLVGDKEEEAVAHD